eukprot:TRINITY_DN1392_c0_g2_i1.p1 TRINITY_DN1392_c0_g2~~TRINITY_DN1392_c0_g2_i1.p1  ORF type:complete len:344 (-),score=127.91 TRINITY_DN1392_c0_g2_i1:81-1112(-)
MAPQAASDAEKVAEFIADFQGSSASLLEEATQATLRSQLRSAEEEASKQVGNHDEIERAKALLQDARDAAEVAAEAERAASEELGSHAGKLADVQAELASAKSARAAAEKAGAQFAREGQKLREAKTNNEVTVGSLEMLSGGTWNDEEAKSLALTSLQSYLEDIRAEKTLVAAVPGLGVKPEERGPFDKCTVDFVSEVLTETARNVEEQLAARAPAEKEAKTELMGLSALVDVCQEKVELAEGEHANISEALRTAKAAAKASQQKATKLETSLGKLSARHQMQEEKAEAAREALAALERLIEAAREAQTGEEVAEPEPKKAKTESVTSPRPELAVASPARVRA